MLLNGKLKRVALLAAVDICLKKTNLSPKRCTRNLIELGASAYPGKLSEAGRNELYRKLLSLIAAGDLSGAKALFSSAFFSEV
jgi:hypothetical protein